MEQQTQGDAGAQGREDTSGRKNLIFFASRVVDTFKKNPTTTSGKRAGLASKVGGGLTIFPPIIYTILKKIDNENAIDHDENNIEDYMDLAEGFLEGTAAIGLVILLMGLYFAYKDRVAQAEQEMEALKKYSLLEKEFTELAWNPDQVKKVLERECPDDVGQQANLFINIVEKCKTTAVGSAGFCLHRMNNNDLLLQEIVRKAIFSDSHRCNELIENIKIYGKENIFARGTEIEVLKKCWNPTAAKEMLERECPNNVKKQADLFVKIIESCDVAQEKLLPWFQNREKNDPLRKLADAISKKIQASRSLYCQRI